MKQTIITIVLIILVFVALIAGILVYAHNKNNPKVEEFKKETLEINLNEISVEKTFEGEEKFIITDIIHEPEDLTMYLTSYFSLQTYRDLRLSAAEPHTHDDESEPNMGMGSGLLYFEIVDEEGNKLCGEYESLIDVNEPKNFVLFIKKPVVGNKLFIKVYDFTTDALLGEKTLEVSGL